MKSASKSGMRRCQRLPEVTHPVIRRDRQDVHQNACPGDFGRFSVISSNYLGKASLSGDMDVGRGDSTGQTLRQSLAHVKPDLEPSTTAMFDVRGSRIVARTVVWIWVRRSAFAV